MSAAARTYEIFDVRTRSVVGKPYASRQRASARANKLDLAYGAVRYVVRPVQAP